MTGKLRSVLALGIPIILALVLSAILQATLLQNSEKVLFWLEQFGPYVLLVYIILQAVTIIIAPLGGFFLQVALIALFGPFKALILVYFVATPIYLVNFYIARKYGRPLVEKIVGSKALEKIDHLALDAGLSTLIILKVFQGNIFDYLSYAIGLTQTPFKTFAIVNILGGIPGSIIFYLILKNSPDLTTGIASTIFVSYLFMGISILITHLIKKHRKI